jgi:DNA-binding response OmpR family regulator
MHHPQTPDGENVAPDVEGRKSKVLVAEDDDDIRSVFEMVLGDIYEIRSAATAAAALALAAAWTPDVVLLDWTLPDGSGDDVVSRLRGLRPDFASLPVVVVSGAPGVRALATDIGAVPCPKPCDIEQLTSAIELALAPTRGG